MLEAKQNAGVLTEDWYPDFDYSWYSAYHI